MKKNREHISWHCPFQCRIFHSKSTKISLLSILFESPISREEIHFKKCFAAVLDLIIYEACKRKLAWSVFHPPPKTRIRKSRRLFHPCLQLAHSGSKLTAIANIKPNFGLDGPAVPQIVMKQDNLCWVAKITSLFLCSLAGPFAEEVFSCHSTKTTRCLWLIVYIWTVASGYCRHPGRIAPLKPTSTMTSIKIISKGKELDYIYKSSLNIHGNLKKPHVYGQWSGSLHDQVFGVIRSGLLYMLPLHLRSFQIIW